LWRRIVFSVLISNVDDHLRNHGFLYAGTDGWTLSPAFDLNPMPIDVKPRVLSTAIDEEEQTASVELALSVAAYFDLDQQAARDMAGEVAKVVSTWRDEAGRFGLSSTACSRMESAFAHADLEVALGFS
jgi:serine/threonine-protein kinase HipA